MAASSGTVACAFLPHDMAQQFAPIHDYYMPLHELQPAAAQLYHHYDIPIATQSAIQTYEMTVESVVRTGGACEPSCALVSAQHSPHQPISQSMHLQPLIHPKKKNNTHFSCTEVFNMGECNIPPTQPRTPAASLSVPSTSSRKRKSSSYGTGSLYDDDIGEECFSARILPDKKQNHSEIEKRRRDKMNTYISELSSMVPMCGAMSRKLDKLTVLRMAVQHLRSVRGTLSACPLTASPRPAFLSERELNSLILHAGQDCFLFVVGCDRGRLIYVSASVKNMLLYDQSELIGQSLFDILHPKDVAKVKEQLSSSDLSPRERFIDAKTMLPVKADVVTGASRFSPGARRSFFCRIKCKAPPDQSSPSAIPVKEEPDPTSKLRKKQSFERKYCVVQCTGYLKSWAPAELSEGDSPVSDGTEDGEMRNLSCLVAVGRTLEDLVPMPEEIVSTFPTTPTRQLQYISRHATDGKFIFVDQRVTLALGFLPQELLGTSLYEYVSGPEISAVARTHKAALLHRDALQTPAYSFRRKDGSFASIQTHFKPFRNPWTKDVECLVANNTVLLESSLSPHLNAAQDNFEIYKQNSDVEMERLIDCQVESHKIGSAIAEEVLRRSPIEYSTELPSDLLQDAVFSQQASLENILGLEVPECMHVRNNVPLSDAGANNSPPHTEPDINLPEGTPPSPSPPLSSLGIDGNGEATMAVIMSLLEADAGLGGPINFSGLPWPLP